MQVLGRRPKHVTALAWLLTRTLWDESGCLLWFGYKKNGRYGHLHIDDVGRPAHVWMWILMYGEIPEGYEVCHPCDVEACVRPDHLFLATHRDNMVDCVTKGRHGGRNQYS